MYDIEANLNHWLKIGNRVFRGVTPRNLVDRFQRFRETCYLSSLSSTLWKMYQVFLWTSVLIKELKPLTLLLTIPEILKLHLSDKELCKNIVVILKGHQKDILETRASFISFNHRVIMDLVLHLKGKKLWKGATLHTLCPLYGEAQWVKRECGVETAGVTWRSVSIYWLVRGNSTTRQGVGSPSRRTTCQCQRLIQRSK